MEATARRVSGRAGNAEGGAAAARPGNRQGGARPCSGSAEPLPPLPRRGDRLTEDQLSERFGAPARGGTRASLTSSDIVLVRRVNGGCGGAEGGGRITYDGQYYGGESDQMIRGNLKLAKSRESASRVLYFSKNDGMLVFHGLVECVAHRDKDDPARPGALTFELEMVGTAAAEKPVHILSREERRSADLDNDLPFSAGIEQMIADCEAGIPIGKTYAIDEHLRQLDQLIGNHA